jgi:hypothetical protein
VIQVIIQIKTLEETFTDILRQIWFFGWSVDKINRPPGRVQDHAAVLTSREMLFKLLAEGWGQFTVNILR